MRLFGPSASIKILTGAQDALDDSDLAVKELALSVIVEMFDNKKNALKDFVENLMEKFIHTTKDLVAKVSSKVDRFIFMSCIGASRLCNADAYNFLENVGTHLCVWIIAMVPGIGSEDTLCVRGNKDAKTVKENVHRWNVAAYDIYIDAKANFNEKYKE
eukprot:Gb_06406 [translate_table: standard]